MRTVSSLSSSVVLAALIVAGCSLVSKPQYYCYDGGRIWVGDPGQGVWNGLAVIQLRFEIPHVANPNTWRPPRGLVLQQLAAIESKQGLQLPANYRREDYCTNFITFLEYQRRTQEHK